MTDLELAEEIGGMIFDAIKHGDEKHQAWLHDKSHELAPQLIAALRRGPEHEGLYEKLWKDFVSLQRGDAQGILAKVEAYYRERPPSGEMVAMRKVRKVHMRVIDDLKADLADEAPARFQLQAALERAQTKWQQAQSRIAELEKVVKFLLGEEALLGFWFGERPEGQPQFWWRKHLREALKDRA